MGGTENAKNTGNEKRFTQAEINEIVKSRIAREKKTWEKENKGKVDINQVKDLNLQLTQYQKQLALSKYNVNEKFKKFVEYSVLRNVSKDKDYAQAVEEFFSNNENKNFLQDDGSKQLNNSKAELVSSWLKENNASEKAIPLLSKAIDLSSVEIQDGKIKDISILEPLKNDYKDFFIQTQVGGAEASNPPPTNNMPQEPKTMAEAIAQKIGKV